MSGSAFDTFRTCGDVGRGISRIWVVWWIDRVEGGRGRWKSRISVSANTVIADMARNARKTTAGVMDMRGNSIVLLEKYEGREVCQWS
jgi:hypothetical protein